MTKYAKFVLFCLVLLAYAQAGFSQSVDEIINRHVNAMGGIDKINAVKSLRLTGKFTEDSIEIPFTILIKGKDKVRTEVIIKGKKLILTYDGSAGWFVNPYSDKPDAQQMDAEDIKEMKETAEWEGQLVNYKEKGYKAENADTGNGISDKYRIKLTDSDGRVTYYSLDGAYLITKKSKLINIDGEELMHNIFPGSYSPVGGIMFPGTIEMRYSWTNHFEMGEFSKVELNVEINDSEFTKPEAIK